jgi:hypothetical protein
MYAQRAIKLAPNNAGAWINAHSAAAGIESYHLAYKYGKKGFELSKRKTLAKNMEVLCNMLNKPIEAAYYHNMIPTLKK